MIVLIIKIMANNTMYTVQEVHTIYNHSKFHYKSFHFHQYFHCILLQLIHQLFYSYTCNSYSVNIVLII